MEGKSYPHMEDAEEGWVARLAHPHGRVTVKAVETL